MATGVRAPASDRRDISLRQKSIECGGRHESFRIGPAQAKERHRSAGYGSQNRCSRVKPAEQGDSISL